MKPTTTLTPIERIKRIHEERAEQKLSQDRHRENQLASISTQETIVKALRSLVEYLDNPRRVTKTSVVNQLKTIGTPDALRVVEAVNDLHNTVKEHKDTDLSEVTTILKNVLGEVEKIPKNTPDITIPETVTVKNMPDNTSDFKELLKAVKAIKLVAEAPVVTVDAPIVENKTDLNPLLKKMTEQIKTVKEGQAEIVDGAMQTVDMSSMISFPYNDFRITYADEDFDDSDDQKPEKIDYYDGKKKTGTMTFKYNKRGNVTRVSVQEWK